MSHVCVKAWSKGKAETIREALKGSSGMWVREIARKTGLDKSTVSRHLIAMDRGVEFEVMGRNKIYRLK